MKKHATTIKGFATLEEAAQAIGKMRYDALAEFFEHLTDELMKQREKDIKVGKVKLAEDSQSAILAVGRASMCMDTLFEKYKKFMKDELDD